jgi:two-component system cell cycle sensor histidine kinase/response regulator CckA
MRSAEELALIASIADDLPCGVWVATAPEGRFVYANRAFEEIMGMGPVDVGVGEYTVPYGIYGRDGKLYPEHRLPFGRAVEAGTTVVVDDLVIHRRDGRRVYVRATGKPIANEEGVIRFVAIAFFDITREAEAEEAQALTETRLRKVIAHAPVVLSAFDRDGKVTLAQGRGLDRLGVQADFVGKSVFDLYPEAPMIASGARRALAGEANSFVAELSAGAYEAHLAPMYDATGAIVGSISVSIDVTDRHRLQAQLARAERMASLGMLAAGVAHEVNNPLSFVLGNLELIQRDLDAMRGSAPAEVVERFEECVRDARTGAERVRAIVGQLKVFSRVDEQPMRPVDVLVSVESALSMAHNEIRHRARLVRDLAPVNKVMADEGRLSQVFLNLLLNAAQAIPEGDEAGNEVRVVLRQTARYVHFEVHDTGVGIAPDVLPKIFDPFFTTKSVGVGTGLGLAICHAIVTALGGRIELASSPGQKTLARVTLPAVTTALHAETPEPRGDGQAKKRGRILVIDDEPLLAKMIAATLALEHDVVSETSARAALALLRTGERFDAIVCDLMMPQLSGMDLYDTLLDFAPTQAEVMLFLTGGAFTPRARAFAERLSKVTLEKPVEASILTARVRSLVG